MREAGITLSTISELHHIMEDVLVAIAMAFNNLLDGVMANSDDTSQNRGNDNTSYRMCLLLSV